MQNNINGDDIICGRVNSKRLEPYAINGLCIICFFGFDAWKILTVF